MITLPENTEAAKRWCGHFLWIFGTQQYLGFYLKNIFVANAFISPFQHTNNTY
jgi:hypothetical protein